MDASCAASGRAELVGDVGQHRVPGPARALQFGLVAHHLHLDVVDHAGAGDDGRADVAFAHVQALGGPGRARGAGLQDRAVGVAGPHATGGRRPQDVAAEPAHGLGAGDAQQLFGAGVQVADAAVAIHGEHALDDALEHGLGLGLALAERVGELDEIAAHVLHGAGQRAHLGRAVQRDGRGEVTLAKARRRGGEAAHGSGDAAAQQRPGAHGQQPEDQRR
jgi:hypothetical protein